MSATNPGPRCPRCRRPLAAWKLNHCIYCGEPFPAELKDGFSEPESLKWVERPALPADLAKKVEMLRIQPSEAPRQARSVTAILGGFAVPVFAALFYLLFLMIKRMSMFAGVIVIIAGVGVIGYLITLIVNSRRK